MRHVQGDSWAHYRFYDSYKTMNLMTQPSRRFLQRVALAVILIAVVAGGIALLVRPEKQPVPAELLLNSAEVRARQSAIRNSEQLPTAVGSMQLTEQQQDAEIAQIKAWHQKRAAADDVELNK